MKFLRERLPGLRFAYDPEHVDGDALHDPEAFIAAGLARRPPDCPGPPVGGRGRFFVFPGRQGTLLGVRHYQRGGLFGPLLGDRYLDGERALHELDMLHLAGKHGVPTLTPVAAVSVRRGLVWRHYLATVFLEGSLDFAESLRADPLQPQPQSPSVNGATQARLEAAGRAVAKLHDAGFEHRDLNLRNLLVCADTVRVIDLDRARHHPEGLSDALRRKALERLDRSMAKLGFAERTLHWVYFRAGYAPSEALRKSLPPPIANVCR